MNLIIIIINLRQPDDTKVDYNLSYMGIFMLQNDSLIWRRVLNVDEYISILQIVFSCLNS